MKLASKISLWALVVTAMACGGSGSTSTTGTFTLLDWSSKAITVPNITGVANNGTVIGWGAIPPLGSIAQSGSFAWKNGAIQLAQPVIDSRYLRLFTISPNGQYAAGTIYQDEGGLVYRINLNDSTTAICVPPAYKQLTEIEPLFTSDSGTTTGVLKAADISSNFSYTSGDNIDVNTIPGYYAYPTPWHYVFRNSSLAVPGGQTTIQINGSSANQKYAVGKSGVHGCVWNVATAAVTTIDADTPSLGCNARLVSNDGRYVVCDIQGQSYLWSAALGKQKVVDLLHAQGFANAYPVVTVQALSPDGRYIAGTLSDNTKAYNLFVYRMP